MVSEKTSGKILVVGALILIGIYLYMISSPELRGLAITIVVSVIVISVLGMLAWIGWAIARTPPVEIPDGESNGKEESE